jgi:aminoglycoside phosphotransferase family enzyme/predicted kinase
VQPTTPNRFPAALNALLTAEAYPHPVRAVELVETHVSWILLTGEFAYKIKRPVHYPFIDMRQLERRAYLCREELRLNRRFAPELYLEVCAITSRAGVASISGGGEIIEYAVRMREFDREAELDRLLSRSAIEPAELEAFGCTLADIHAGLPIAGASEPWGQAAQTRALVLANLTECVQLGVLQPGSAELSSLLASLHGALLRVEPCLTSRRADGRVRECHGDLHSRNIVRLGKRLTAFDCMEFEPAFRWIDVADEVALLLADLDTRGYGGHASAFLQGYLAQCGDYQACRVLSVYRAHRALVRAKVAQMHSETAPTVETQRELRAEIARLVDYAATALRPRVPQLLLMCGLAGSGKTWLAQRLAPPLAAVVLRSDVERKRRAGLGAHAHSSSALDQGLYSPQVSADLYQHLANCAQDVLAGGYDAIVDGSFLRRADRAHFRSMAARLGIGLRVVHCGAPRELLRERIAQRQQVGADESEADVRVLDLQLTHLEPIRADEGLTVIDVDTRGPDIIGQVLAQCRCPGTSM